MIDESAFDTRILKMLQYNLINQFNIMVLQSVLFPCLRHIYFQLGQFSHISLFWLWAVDFQYNGHLIKEDTSWKQKHCLLCGDHRLHIVYKCVSLASSALCAKSGPSFEQKHGIIFCMEINRTTLLLSSQITTFTCFPRLFFINAFRFNVYKLRNSLFCWKKPEF